jgi:hypothetical protein
VLQKSKIRLPSVQKEFSKLPIRLLLTKIAGCRCSEDWFMQTLSGISRVQRGILTLLGGESLAG